MVETERQMDIFRLNATTYRIQTDKDAILIMLFDGELEFYRHDESIADIRDDKD